MPIKELKELYDPKIFPGVRLETRIVIINAIGIDVNGLTLNEGGKFTEEQLCEGLRYLLATNKDLHTYLEKNPQSSSSSSSYNHNPFYIPTNHVFFPYLLLLNPSFNSGNSSVSNSGCGGSGDNDKALLFCLAIIALAIVIIFLYCTVKNTLSTIKSHEADSVKAAKIILTLSILAATAVLTTYCLAPIASLFMCITAVLLTATALAALVSYISSKFLCLPKIDPPEKELLDELQTVKEILERGYALQGDNKVQCKEFVKEVVRYYIQTISSDHKLGLDQPHTTVIQIDPIDEPSAPLLPKSNGSTYGSFFPRTPLNDELSAITIEPVASKLTK
jgi:hypothetical protein